MVSLIASSVRPQLYESFFKSLEDEDTTFEVVFAGNAWKNEHEDKTEPFIRLTPHFINRKQKPTKYIVTNNIKPAQCYEVARRYATGEVIVWVADDCEFPNGIIGKAYRYWKEQDNKKLILSIQTKESGYPDGRMNTFNMLDHSFFGFKRDTPLMAPLGMMSREYLEELGGIDRRYVCGQYENDIVMRAYADGGEVKVFGDSHTCIVIDHWQKSKICNEGDFLNRPFAKGYEKDREVLEKSWTKDGKVLKTRTDKFEPFDDKDILTKSQSNKGIWE